MDSHFLHGFFLHIFHFCMFSRCLTLVRLFIGLFHVSYVKKERNPLGNLHYGTDMFACRDYHHVSIHMSLLWCLSQAPHIPTPGNFILNMIWTWSRKCCICVTLPGQEVAAWVSLPHQSARLCLTQLNVHVHRERAPATSQQQSDPAAAVEAI